MKCFASAVTALALLAAPAALMLPTSAAAMPVVQPGALAPSALPVEKSAFRFRGRLYCFFNYGWNGPGFYLCGRPYLRPFYLAPGYFSGVGVGGGSGGGYSYRYGFHNSYRYNYRFRNGGRGFHHSGHHGHHGGGHHGHHGGGHHGHHGGGHHGGGHHGGGHHGGGHHGGGHHGGGHRR